jgi:hypothetical protein
MKDKFMYETPYWICGSVFDTLFLKRHMKNFLLQRNRFLKNHCEGLKKDSQSV